MSASPHAEILRLDWTGCRDRVRDGLAAARGQTLRAPAATSGSGQAAAEPEAASRQAVDAAADAVGRSRSPGQLHEQVRAGHAVRAARRIRRAQDRGSQERGTEGHPAGAAGSRAAEHHARRRRSGRQPRRPALVAGPVRGQQGQPAVVRRRSARRQDSADDAEAQRRIAARAAAARATRGSGADSYTDRSLYDRCITRGLPGSMLPAIYGNSYHIVQGPGFVAIRYEMIHETRVIPLDGRPHVGSTIRSTWATPRPLGRQHARRRDDELPGRERLSQRQSRDAEADRALHAHRARHGRVGGDRRRSDDVDAAVDVRDAADDERRASRSWSTRATKAIRRWRTSSAPRGPKRTAVRKGLKSSTSQVPTAAEGER